jgi:hypothetical protein
VVLGRSRGKDSRPPVVRPWPEWGELLPVLVGLDDSENLEAPEGYNFFVERRKFEGLVRRMEKVFGRIEVDWTAQDSSHHGSITVPMSALRSGDAVVVTVSNFENLAAVSLGVPDSYDAEEIDVLFDRSDRDLLGDLLVTSGYVPVAEELLHEEYTGASVIARDSQWPRTWWDRFFTYL